MSCLIWLVYTARIKPSLFTLFCWFGFFFSIILTVSLVGALRGLDVNKSIVKLLFNYGSLSTVFFISLAALISIIHYKKKTGSWLPWRRRVKVMANTPQTYYLVTGSHRITGGETSLYIPADTEGAALERAAVEGISVESIQLKQPEFLRWYQFTLKELLIFMLVSGLFFGWVGKKVMEARKQKVIVDWVYENGGVIYHDFLFDAKGKYIFNAQPPGPDWLRNIIGIDYFCNVEEVSFFTGREIHDRYPGMITKLSQMEIPDLTPLFGLPFLKKLYLGGRLLSNEEMMKLQAELPHCNITYFSSKSWCKQCNDWHAVGSDPHTAEP